jgi:hypothetical protein
MLAVSMQTMNLGNQEHLVVFLFLVESTQFQQTQTSILAESFLFCAIYLSNGEHEMCDCLFDLLASPPKAPVIGGCHLAFDFGEVPGTGFSFLDIPVYLEVDSEWRCRSANISLLVKVLKEKGTTDIPSRFYDFGRSSMDDGCEKRR